MTLLILGIALWIGAHWFKRVAPDARAAMGAKGKGLMALLMVAGIVLMVLGYKQAPYIELWSVPSFMTHINNTLMLIAVWFFALTHTKGAMRGRFRHPMLGSVKIWALAHLLVNGDVASVVLFGSMLAWAVGSVIMINRAEGAYVRPEAGTWAREGITLIITLVTYGIFSGIHIWAGVSPFS